MARLNERFKANSAPEQRILAYVDENASDVLVQRMNGNEYKKNIQSCIVYVRNMAKKQAQNGCACIEDSEVFGWVMHFFEEDSIPAVEVPKADEKNDVSTVPSKDKSGKDNLKITFKAPNVKEIRFAKKQLEQMEEDIVNPDHKPKNEVERWKTEPSKQDKKPEKKAEQKQKKKPDADVEGQISFADLFGGFEP